MFNRNAVSCCLQLANRSHSCLVVSSVVCDGSCCWNLLGYTTSHTAGWCDVNRCGWCSRSGCLTHSWLICAHCVWFRGECTPVSSSHGCHEWGGHDWCGRISDWNFLRRLLRRLTFWRFTRFWWLQRLIRRRRVFVPGGFDAPPFIPVQPCPYAAIVSNVSIMMQTQTNLWREYQRKETLHSDTVK